MRKDYIRTKWLLSLAALATLTGLAACAEQAQTSPTPRPVAWVEVMRYSDTEARRLPGLVQAAQRAPLAFEVPGRVAKVNVNIGEKFAKGDALAQLDNRSFRLTLQEREASLADAQARLVQARKTLGRKLALQKRDVGSQAAVDDARAAKDSTQAQAKRLQALVNLARKDLEDTTLTAPYNGEVLQRLIESSQQVALGATVFEVQGNEGNAEIQVSVPETVVDRVQINDAATVTFPARPQLKLKAHITEIGAGAIEKNAFPVTLVLHATAANVRPGMTAEVNFALPELASGTTKTAANLLTIPVTAFIAGKDQSAAVFVFSKDGKTIHRRQIQVATISGDLALVSSGLSAGEIIASKGLPYLQDGQSVERLNVGVQRFQP